MRIYISCPGFFYQGFNSRLRGEGRWLVNVAGVLQQAGYEVAVLSNDPVRPYKDQGVIFASVHDQLPPECDVLMSMDTFEDVPHLHKTNITPLLSRKFRPQKRVAALFFPTAPEVYDYLPVIHPWNYSQVREGSGFFLPIITHSHLDPPNFEKKRFHWYSKRPNENPEYLLGVLKGLLRLVKGDGASGLFVDGHWILTNDYRNNCPIEIRKEVQQTFMEIMASSPSDSLARWVPYDNARESMASSKMLVGVHHPVAAPSMAEAASDGAFPLIFGNQKQCPPYDQIEIPFIPLDFTNKQVEEFIVRTWSDRQLFESTVLACQDAIKEHAQDRAARRIIQFFEDL